MNVERFLLLILVTGLVGIAVELLVSGHTESAWQWVPLILIGIAFPALGIQTVSGAGRPLRVLMWLFLASGVIGITLHNKAKMEFQLESDRSLSGWALFLKSFDSKNPPALAPGAMVQLGLIGLAYQAARKARSCKLNKEIAA
jgi:hypothetical protein